MNKSTQFTWIHFFSIGIVFVASVLIVRLYIVQVVHGEDYKAKLERQHGSNLTDKNFDRGLIIFQYKDGRDFFAASNQKGFMLGINPQRLKDAEFVYAKLNEIIPLSKEEFMNHTARTDLVHREIAKRVPYDVGIKILELDLPGVELSEQRWRFNPGNHLAAHVIGFLAERDGILSGQYGLERYYDDRLKKDSENLFSNIFVEFYSGLKDVFGENMIEGDIVATIEPNVQAYVEEIAQGVQEVYSSSKTGIIVMNPYTGEIIASAQYPTFDLNNFRTISDVSLFNNSVVEDAYEMGSIIKALTIAIGLEEKVITAQSTYEDKGSLTLNNRTIFNHDKLVRGTTDMQTVLSKSLNTGVAHIVSKVGNEKFAKYMKTFFKEKTGIDLPAETNSLMSNIDSLRDIEVATASYGQGIATTPIQTIRALAALGNGGYIVHPHLVKEIRHGFGVTRTIAYPEPQRIFSKETSEEISRMLTVVVDEALLGGTVALPNYSIAAKTGTAQMAKPNGGYYENKYLHSFFGYFPSFNPQFIILLYTIDPKGVSYASGTLTAPFMDIAKYLINYYEIEPDR